MPIRTAPGVYDLYREHVTNNPATYSGTNVTDDFHQAACEPSTPTQPSRGLVSAYGSQATVDDWYGRVKVQNNQT